MFLPCLEERFLRVVYLTYLEIEEESFGFLILSGVECLSVCFGVFISACV